MHNIVFFAVQRPAALQWAAVWWMQQNEHFLEIHMCENDPEIAQLNSSQVWKNLNFHKRKPHIVQFLARVL